MASTSTMSGRPGTETRRRTPRLVVAALSWVLLALVLLQTYTAGLFLMSDGEFATWHEGLGWSMTYLPFLTLGFGFFARLGKAFWISFAVLFVLIHVQPFLALLSRDDALGWLRALHPVNAIVLAGLAYHQARLAQR